MDGCLSSAKDASCGPNNDYWVSLHLQNGTHPTLIPFSNIAYYTCQHKRPVMKECPAQIPSKTY